MKTQNPQIEQTLADMAYEMLQASHPDLFENMVGFQLIDADDQGSKALGMFALKLGSSYAYIPAFFLNGALKPLEILYLKNKDSMVPLSQEWIDLALRDDVGVGYSEKLPSMGLSNPNLEIYATPPRTGRTVTAESKLDVEDFFGKLTKTAESTIPLPLAISLSEGHIKVAFMKMLQSSPEYLEKICLSALSWSWKNYAQLSLILISKQLKKEDSLTSRLQIEQTKKLLLLKQSVSLKEKQTLEMSVRTQGLLIILRSSKTILTQTVKDFIRSQITLVKRSYIW